MYQTISQPKIWFALVSTILLHILAMVCLSFAPALQLKPKASKPISIKFVIPPKQAQVIEQPKVTEEVPPVIEKKEPKEIPIPKPKKTITPPKNEPKPKPKEKPIQKPKTKLLNTKAKALAKQREIERQNEIKKQLELKQQQQELEKQRLEQERLEKEREQAEQERLEREKLAREEQAREEQQRQEEREAKRKADEAKKQADAKLKAQAGQTITARYSYEAPAKYPNKEQKRGRNGSVSFSFIIGTNGKAKNIQVTNSTSNAFKKSALKALKSSKFHVTKIDGVAVEQKAKKTIIFELN